MVEGGGWRVDGGWVYLLNHGLLNHGRLSHLPERQPGTGSRMRASASSCLPPTSRVSSAGLISYQWYRQLSAAELIILILITPFEDSLIKLITRP